MNQLPTTGFLRLHQPISNPTSPKTIPISTSAWWDGVRTMRFPQSMKLGSRTTGWKVKEVCQLVEKLAASEMLLTGGVK